MNKALLYLAKEPDDGVISDLQSFKHYDITICACNPGYVDYYKLLGYNVITKGQLSDEDMRFDVVVGNPPYQDSNHKNKTVSLWKRFLSVSDEVSNDIVSLIIPASFCSPAKLFKQYKNRLSLVDLTVKKYFKGVGSSFCRIVLHQTPQDKCKVITEGGEYDLDMTQWDCLPKTLDDNLMSLIDRYFTQGDDKWKVSYEYDQRKDCIIDDGAINILHSTRVLKTNTDHPNNHLIRVYQTVTNGTKFDVCYPGTGLSQNNIWMKCDSIDDAERLRDYLNQDDIQYLLKSFQFSNMNYYQIINKLDLENTSLSL